MVTPPMERWADGDLATTHRRVWDEVARIDQEQSSLYAAWKNYTELYLDETISGFAPGEWRTQYGLRPENRVSWNVVRACVDSVTARLTQSAPATKIQTFDGTELLQRQAKTLEQIIRTVQLREDAYRSARRCVKNTAVAGTGVLYTYGRHDDWQIDCIHPSRIKVDNQASLNGRPPAYFYDDVFDRGDLLEHFAKDKRALRLISAAPTAAGQRLQPRDGVRVIEAYRVARGDRKGRHAITIDNGTLYLADWLEPRPPFSFMRWQEDLQGFYGLPLVGEIESCQHELNEVIDYLRNNAHHLGYAYWFDKLGAASADDQEALEAMRFRYVKGVEPGQVVHPPIAHEQWFRWAEILWEKSFALCGLSQLTATATKPAGLRSGSALRTYHDIETTRFSDMARQFMALFADLGWQINRVGRQLFGAGSKKLINVMLLAPGGRRQFMRQVPWVTLEESQCAITSESASSLPMDAAGRQERVTEAMDRGLVDRTEARQMLGWVDLEKSDWIASAAADNLERIFEGMLQTGKYTPPLEHHDLERGLTLVRSYLNHYEGSIEPERLELLQKWGEDAKQLADEAAANANVQPAVSGALPADPAAAQALMAAQGGLAA